ncbi:MAG: flagellar hook capping FlgD N-terminal domain-containing protein [Limisphaerales bacterium]
MNVTQTTNVASSTNNAATLAERMPVQMLGQEEFIKILVTQMRSQDPLNPQKDTEFIGQMAQFSGLESTKAMQAEIQSLRANSLIGHTVEIDDGESNVVGEVSSIDKIQGELKIIVGGVPYSMSDVIRVQRTAPAPPQVDRPTAPLSKTPTSTQ